MKAECREEGPTAHGAKGLEMRRRCLVHSSGDPDRLHRCGIQANVRLLRPFARSAIFWGGGAGIAVALFMSPVPLFQKDVLRKIPVVRLIDWCAADGQIKDYFTDKTPACDKPF